MSEGQTAALNEVAIAALRSVWARRALIDAVAEARRLGASFGDIGDAANMTRQGARQLLMRSQNDDR